MNQDQDQESRELGTEVKLNLNYLFWARDRETTPCYFAWESEHYEKPEIRGLIKDITDIFNKMSKISNIKLTNEIPDYLEQDSGYRTLTQEEITEVNQNMGKNCFE